MQVTVILGGLTSSPDEGNYLSMITFKQWLVAMILLWAFLVAYWLNGPTWLGVIAAIGFFLLMVDRIVAWLRSRSAGQRTT